VTAEPASSSRRHLYWLFGIWLALSAVVVPLVIFVLGPQLPPGSMTVEAHGQTQANIVMTATIAPVFLLVVVFFVYAIVAFRQRKGALEDGPPIRGNSRAIVLWLVATVTTVMFLAAWGSYELFPGDTGAGGGAGPRPVFTPADSKSALQVQVVAQQWAWTFRYPTLGNFESLQLALPVGRLVALHVTSLDVTHSFWAYKLGVKADAVPGADNIAYVKAKSTGNFTIRCAELCGLWHGHMFTKGYVLGDSAFSNWVARVQKENAPSTKFLPPYSHTYFPAPFRRAG
jgi:cytochrome c oxidase subunit II